MHRGGLPPKFRRQSAGRVGGLRRREGHDDIVIRRPAASGAKSGFEVRRLTAMNIHINHFSLERATRSNWRRVCGRRREAQLLTGECGARHFLPHGAAG